MYEPVCGLSPFLVNHNVDVLGATIVVTREYGSYLYHTIRVGVPTTTEPGLRSVGRVGFVSAIKASCIG